METVPRKGGRYKLLDFTKNGMLWISPLRLFTCHFNHGIGHLYSNSIDELPVPRLKVAFSGVYPIFRPRSSYQTGYILYLPWCQHRPYGWIPTTDHQPTMISPYPIISDDNIYIYIYTLYVCIYNILLYIYCIYIYIVYIYIVYIYILCMYIYIYSPPPTTPFFNSSLATQYSIWHLYMSLICWGALDAADDHANPVGIESLF